MDQQPRTWAIVLAAGDGARLARLTTDDDGNAVPKQYCSLAGGDSLLQEALQRASALVPMQRVCTIVAGQHERYWRRGLRALEPRNVIVQPRNRGTANGILLALLSVLSRDPHARVVFLPADHHVPDEAALAETLRRAVTLTHSARQALLLVGIEPDDADPELGYILPGACDAQGASSVKCFVEKPDRPLARDLIRRGAVWNSFIFAARGVALLDMLRECMPRIVADMESALSREVRKPGALEALYASLPSVDFSSAVMQGAEARLALLSAPACGWTDLGTPRRVAQALLRLGPAHTPHARRAATARSVAFVNLAARHARLSIAG